MSATQGYKEAGMRFVLTYSGLLPPNGTLKDKHSIRQTLHPQLAQQWKIEPAFQSMNNSQVVGFSRGAFRFVPLVTKKHHLLCYLALTILRREEPGDIIRHGGDIDNRIKTLFDSLRVPDEAQLQNILPAQGESPFYCLLEDDSLVVGFEVKTERLLEAQTSVEDYSVRVVLTVLIRPTRVEIGNLSFLGGWL